jgi:hypothetical protein
MITKEMVDPKNIRKATTPTLIQEGERDKRVPPPIVFESCRSLREIGIPARLIVYAGPDHGITKPGFSHYVFGEPFPKASELFGPAAVVDPTAGLAALSRRVP